MMFMVMVNYLADVRIVPAWLKHATDTGLTVADLIAPAFIVAIGLTYGASYRRRRDTDGRGAAVAHFLRRWFAIMGIGAIISAGEGITGVSGRAVDWGVLQAIGAAGLLTLPLLTRPVWVRLIAGVLVLAIYQSGLTLFLEEYVLMSSHGGLWGSLSWAAMLILATAFGDLVSRYWPDSAGPDDNRRRSFAVAAVACVAFVAAGMLLSLLVPISKPRVSASYVLVSIGAGAAVFWLIVAAGLWRRFRVPVLVWWGRNPLVLYVLHYFLLAMLVLPDVDRWHAAAPPLLVVFQAVAIAGNLSIVGWLMHRRHIVLSL